MGPIHGLGVDQMLEVELVGADGSCIIANMPMERQLDQQVRS